MARYEIEFYAPLRDEVIVRVIEASSKEEAIIGVKYYHASKDDVIRCDEIKEE